MGFKEVKCPTCGEPVVMPEKADECFQCWRDRVKAKEDMKATAWTVFWVVTTYLAASAVADLIMGNS